jgi:hypothetical protein
MFIDASAQADTLVLRSDKSLHGTLIGATARQVDFLVNSRKTEPIPVVDIIRISFSAPAVAAPGSSNKPATPKPSAVIPADTDFHESNKCQSAKI